MTNPWRGKDPRPDPYVPTGSLGSEDVSGTRHPSRMEPTQSTLKPSQTDPLDAAQWQLVNALSVANGAIVTWDTLGFDSAGWSGKQTLASIAFSGTTFTIPQTGRITGVWLFHAKLTWPGTGAGVSRGINITRNGTVIATTNGLATALTQDVHALVYNPSRGDAFKVTVTQDSGGALALTVGSSLNSFEVHHPW